MKKSLLLGLMLLGAASAYAEVQVDNMQSQDIPTPDGSYLNFANSYIYHAGSASETILSTTSDYAIGNFRKGSYVVFELNNTVANNSGYTVAFEQNHKNSGGQVIFALYTENPVENTETKAFATYTYSLEAMNDWTTYKAASFNFNTKFPAGTLYMKMTATTTENQSFAGNIKNVTMTAIEKVIEYYTLTTTVNNDAYGSVTGNDKESYAAGSTVSLQATAKPGYRFVHWAIGETESTDNPLSLTIDANTAVEAVFEEIPNALGTDGNINLADWYSTSGTLSVSPTSIESTKNKASVIYRFWDLPKTSIYFVDIAWGSKYDTTLTVNISEDPDNFSEATAVSRDLTKTGDDWKPVDQGFWHSFSLETGKTYYLKISFATTSGWAGNIDSIKVIDSTTTAVDEIAADSVASDDVYYNLQGMRVDNPGRGLYIKNGKKVFVK